MRYVELNPVRAGLAKEPGAYRWSSVAAHLPGEDDSLVELGPLPGMVADWGQFLASWSEEDESALRRHERTGRPPGTKGSWRSWGG